MVLLQSVGAASTADLSLFALEDSVELVSPGDLQARDGDPVQRLDALLIRRSRGRRCDGAQGTNEEPLS